MQRIGMVIRVKPEKLEEYKRLHAQPWPGVLETLRRVGVRNYSIFQHADLLFGYLEFQGESWEEAQKAIAADPVTQAWWKLTDPCQEPLPSAREGEWWARMEQVFLME
ncbi:MAG: L-rhamnose mutarotase [Thermaceae bacterium]|nr:L-rhamnose mutarotase [Thermaceae bacterium]